MLVKYLYIELSKSSHQKDVVTNCMSGANLVTALLLTRKKQHHNLTTSSLHLLFHEWEVMEKFT